MNTVKSLRICEKKSEPNLLREPGNFGFAWLAPVVGHGAIISVRALATKQANATLSQRVAALLGS